MTQVGFLALLIEVEIFGGLGETNCLPIGNEEKVMNYLSNQVDNAIWNVKEFKNDRWEILPSGTKIATYKKNVDGELVPYLKRWMNTLMSNSISLKRTDLSSAMFYSALVCRDGKRYGLVLWDLEFQMQRNSDGTFSFPQYEITLTPGLDVPLYLNGVTRAVLVRRTTTGEEVERIDSNDYASEPRLGFLKVKAAENLLLLPTEYAVSGGPGELILYFGAGKQQVFDLETGLERRPKLQIATENGIIFLVISGGVPHSKVSVEQSSDFKNWAECATCTLDGYGTFTLPAPKGGPLFFKAKMDVD